MSGEKLVFWTTMLLLAHVYLGYPALLWAWATVRARRPAPCRIDPPVSLLIVAYNEARNIDRRLRNALSLDYPRDRLEILVASDGSSDATAALARAHEQAGVTVIAFGARRGKAAVLNDLVPKARGEIVALADARQRFEEGALRALVRPFGDPAVGAVSGELMLARTPAETAVGGGVGAYWRYEKFIRRHESLVDSSVGATGAIYAIRRGLFEPIPEDTILDDVLIPLRITRRGYRVLFEPAARAWDRPAASAQGEFGRKARTLAGNFQLLWREGWLLNPFRNRLWLQTLSHKGLRLLTPLLQGVALGANVLILDGWLYRLALAGQIAFYAAALVGYARRDARRSTPLLTVPYIVCLFSWATVVGFVRFVTGGQRVTWERPSTTAASS